MSFINRCIRDCTQVIVLKKSSAIDYAINTFDTEAFFFKTKVGPVITPVAF